MDFGVHKYVYAEAGGCIHICAKAGGGDGGKTEFVYTDSGRYCREEGGCAQKYVYAQDGERVHTCAYSGAGTTRITKYMFAGLQIGIRRAHSLTVLFDRNFGSATLNRSFRQTRE